MQILNNETMLRIRDKNLLDKLQEMFNESKFTSYNAFLNNLLRQVVFRENKEDEIIDKLDNIEDKTNAIYDKVIFVGHGMAFRTLTYIEQMKPTEIVECDYHIGQKDCEYSFY